MSLQGPRKIIFTYRIYKNARTHHKKTFCENLEIHFPAHSFASCSLNNAYSERPRDWPADVLTTSSCRKQGKGANSIPA